MVATTRERLEALVQEARRAERERCVLELQRLAVFSSESEAIVLRKAAAVLQKRGGR